MANLLCRIRAPLSRRMRESDLMQMRWIISAIAAVIVLLGGMMIAAYFRLESRMDELSTSSTKIETKLEDLLARIPPVATPAPKR